MHTGAPVSVGSCLMSWSVTVRGRCWPRRCAARGLPRHPRTALLVPRRWQRAQPLPKSAQPGAKAALAKIWGAEDKDHALKAATAFADLYGVKWPKATAKITEHLDVLLAFYDYPAKH